MTAPTILNVTSFPSHFITTTQTIDSSHTWTSERYGNMAATIIPGVLCLYAGCTLIVYEVISRSRNPGRNELSGNERILDVASRTLCLFLAIIGFGACFFKLLPMVNMDKQETARAESLCVGTSLIRDWLLITNTATVFCFFWVKQRTFYINPGLKHLNCWFLTVVSHVMLTFSVAFYICASGVLFGLMKYTIVAKDGCAFLKKKGPEVKTHYLTWLTACSFLQVCLLALFAYPLLRRVFQKWQDNDFSGTRKMLYWRLNKAFMLAIMCVGTDVATYIIYFVISKRKFSIYTINLAVNLYTTIFCLEFWKKIIFPWNMKNCCTRKTFPPRQVGNPNSQSQISSTTIATVV